MSKAFRQWKAWRIEGDLMGDKRRPYTMRTYRMLRHRLEMRRKWNRQGELEWKAMQNHWRGRA